MKIIDNLGDLTYIIFQKPIYYDFFEIKNSVFEDDFISIPYLDRELMVKLKILTSNDLVPEIVISNYDNKCEIICLILGDDIYDIVLQNDDISKIKIAIEHIKNISGIIDK